MPRVFVSSADISANIVSIEGSDARHLGLVLRLSPGDTFVAVDEFGREHTATVDVIQRGLITGRIVETREPEVEPRTQVWLAQALPKGSKMDSIVRTCTELGVFSISPMITERVLTRPEDEKAEERRNRWQRIAAEASKQSCRTVIPEVYPMAPFEEALERITGLDLCLLFSEVEQRRSVREVLRQGVTATTVGMIVGPEGGFSVAEVEAAVRVGAVPVTLGPRILRTETAPIAALSICLYELGEMGER